MAHICFLIKCMVIWYFTECSFTIGYTWRPVLMVEEKPGNPSERTTDPRQYWHLPRDFTVSESPFLRCKHSMATNMMTIIASQSATAPPLAWRNLFLLLNCMVIWYIFTECSFTIVSDRCPENSKVPKLQQVSAKHKTKAYLCGDHANVSSLKPYGEDQVCCFKTLHNKFDVQGRERGCCGDKLFYIKMCTCNNGTLESNDSGCPLDQCLATASNSSQQDITKISSASSKVPANKLCVHTCFDPSREVCCQDGVYNGRNVCPSLETNSKFCTDNERLDQRNICAKKYKHGYRISFRETIAQDSRYRLFNATVSESQRLSKERFVKLKIDVFGRCNYTLTGTTFTVFSTQKYKWNADPYFYLDKDDFVLRKHIRKNRLIRIIKNCKKSTQKYEMNTGIESVSNSGDKQFCHTHSSVTLEFIFCIGVYFIFR